MSRADGLAPVHIRPLLEIHCLPRKDQQHHVSNRIIMDLFELGLIEKCLREDESAEVYSEYTTSERGRVYVEALTNLPLPVQQWVCLVT